LRANIGKFFFQNIVLSANFKYAFVSVMAQQLKLTRSNEADIASFDECDSYL